MTQRRACPPAPGPLEDFAIGFDDLFGTLAQRRGFRAYLQGLLLPRDRNKTLTAVASRGRASVGCSASKTGSARSAHPAA
jgi:hypothetical protein